MSLSSKYHSVSLGVKLILLPRVTTSVKVIFAFFKIFFVCFVLFCTNFKGIWKLPSKRNWKSCFFPIKNKAKAVVSAVKMDSCKSRFMLCHGEISLANYYSLLQRSSSTSASCGKWGFTLIKDNTNTPFSLRVLLCIGDVFCFEKLGKSPSAACHLTRSPSVLWSDCCVHWRFVCTKICASTATSLLYTR